MKRASQYISLTIFEVRAFSKDDATMPHLRNGLD